jgi:PHP family Zn ribbon phosphoesterase
VKKFTADLHIHTALSPCADDEMTPPAIVRQALRKGLSMIAICDHNAAGNAAAVPRAAGDRLTVIAGMELTTREEVHLLGYFPDAESAMQAGEAALRTLPERTDPGGRFGRQLLMDATGKVRGEENRMLSAATGFDVTAGVRLVKEHGGLAVAAHVNKKAFNVFTQLGVFPAGAGFDAIELCAARKPPPWQAEIDSLKLPVIRSSDSHFLNDIGCRQTSLRMEAATFDELALAFSGEDGREVF